MAGLISFRIPQQLQACLCMQLLQARNIILQLCLTQTSLVPCSPGALGNPYLIQHATWCFFFPLGAELFNKAVTAPNQDFRQLVQILHPLIWISQCYAVVITPTSSASVDKTHVSMPTIILPDVLVFHPHSLSYSRDPAKTLRCAGRSFGTPLPQPTPAQAGSRFWAPKPRCRTFRKC